MAKRQRIDSSSAAIVVMAAASKDIQPPSHVGLEDDEMPSWRAIIAERVKADWSSHDIELAALLARDLAALGREQVLLRDEGSVLASSGGNPIQNPRLRVVGDLHSRVVKARQTLGLHARGKFGEARSQAKRHEIARTYEVDNPLEDDLLARPSIQ